MTVDADQNDQQNLRVKFDNMYVFPFDTMYIPNKFPTQRAEQPTARKPVRRSKKPAARQTIQPAVQPVVQPVVQPEVQPVQSARTLRNARRVNRKAS